MHVMAGLMIDGDGRVLLAERPAGKHLAGFWEFPGGKLEPGELPLEALTRELREELGIELQTAQPLIRVPWTYDDRHLVLDAWRVDAWLGAPQSLEGQALTWCAPDAIDPQSMTPADRPILQALRLPAMYAVTPADLQLDQRDAWIARVDEKFGGGLRLLQLCLPHWPVESVRALARELQPAAQRHGAQLLLHGDIDGARQLGVGVQLDIAQCAGLSERPLPWRQLVGVTCRHACDLAAATRLSADFATLLLGGDGSGSSPFDAARAWANLQSLAETASLPVYVEHDISTLEPAQAKRCGAQGRVITLG
jgi:8-oxo-dGTP diphosphatase